MKYYYKNNDGDEQGPVTPKALKALASDGVIKSDTEVRSEKAKKHKTWGQLKQELEQDTIKDLSMWKALGLSIVNILLQFFTLPVTVYTGACKSLVQWGRAGKLPGAESDFPVTTFILISMKPLLIVLSPIFMAILSVLSLITGEFGAFLLGLLGAYLIIPALSFAMEALSMGVAAVNALIDIRRDLDKR